MKAFRKFILRLFTGVSLFFIAACNDKEISEYDSPDTSTRDWGRSVEVDVNNSGTTDIHFYYQIISAEMGDRDAIVVSESETFLALKAEHNEAMFSLKENSGYFEKFSQVDSTLNWISRNNGPLAKLSWRSKKGYDELWRGSWAGVKNKYIPVRLMVDQSTYYGWLDVSVDLHTSQVTVHDSFLQTVADQVVYTGEKI